MNYLTEISGGLGKLRTPVETKAFSLYKYGLHKVPDTKTVPFSVVTNGKLVYGDIQKARFTLELGTATVITFPIPANDYWRDEVLKMQTEMRSLLTDFKDKMLALNDAGNIIPAHKQGQHVQPIWPIISGTNAVLFKDMKYQYFGVWEQHIKEALNDLQYKFTQEILRKGKRPAVLPGIVGLGQLVTNKSKELVVKRKPGLRISFYDNTMEAGIYLREDAHRYNDQRTYIKWLVLFATVIEDMAPVRGYMLEDYMAEAAFIIAEHKIGENNFDTMHYDAADVMDSILSGLGAGYNEGFAWNPSMDWSRYIVYQLVKHLVLSRTSSTTDFIRIEQRKGDKMVGAAKFMEWTQPQLPSVGSNGGIYLPMASTYVDSYMLLPMLCRDVDEKGVPLVNEQVYHRVRKNFVTTGVQLERGEINTSVLEPMDRKETFITIGLVTDSRRWDIEYVDHILMLWKFNIAESFDSVAFQNESEIADTLFFFTEFGGTDNTLADGWFIRAGSNMLKMDVMIENVNQSTGTGMVVKDVKTNAVGMSTPQNIYNDRQIETRNTKLSAQPNAATVVDGAIAEGRSAAEIKAEITKTLTSTNSGEGDKADVNTTTAGAESSKSEQDAGTGS